MKFLIQLLLAVCCSLLPAAMMAAPVGAITDASGERIGIRDIPDRGDYPEKIHRRYCAEKATFPAIKASVLNPNGIVSDRRMPAGEILEIRCRALRAAWKTLPAFGDGSLYSRELKEVNAKLASLETELKSLRLAVADISPVVRQTLLTVSSESVPWWEKPMFWNFVLFVVVIALLIAALVGQPYYQELFFGRRSFSLGAAEPGLRSRSDRLYRTVWIDHPENEPDVLNIFVALETPLRKLRLFRYRIPKDTRTGGYRLIQPHETTEAQVAANEVLEAVDRYFGNIPPNNADERRLVEVALHDGRLKEISSTKIRQGI